MSRAGKQHTGRKKRTTNRPREVWTAQRRRRRRELGQNSLKHEKTAKRIVREVGITEKDLVVEIGAGSGVLTRPLADEPFRVLANVPFHLTTAILHRLLDDPAPPSERLHLLLEKEVANKHARSTPTTLKTLTWSPRWRFEVGHEVPASAFDPKPKVDARLLVVQRRNPPLIPYTSTGSRSGRSQEPRLTVAATRWIRSCARTSRKDRFAGSRTRTGSLSTPSPRG